MKIKQVCLNTSSGRLCINTVHKIKNETFKASSIGQVENKEQK